MRFKGLDLNLLGVFETLMRTRSVSRTAEELHLSQPAISSALRRIREYFDDEILVTHSKRMFPTAYAESLLPQVRESLRAIENVIATSAGFDPTTSQRTFRLAASDYIVTALLAPLCRRLTTEAPSVRLELLFNDDQSIGQLEQGDVDLVIAPDGYIAHNLPAEHLLDDRHVVVGWNENPLFAKRIDEAAFLSAGHIQVAVGPQRTTVFEDRELNILGKKRRIELIASSFTLLPWLLVKTDRLALMHERLALVMAEHHPIALAELPFSFPLLREMVQYHPARANDTGLIWLRKRLQEQALIDNVRK
ncbi:LysR family transcriptional regulator [Allorhizobium taibaishanense]|uniref:DNA-binding transcriptional LysR family regulator n=1 Tax=Allorhizobium taibaishanense TaxID=887144 RepID=A0A1Q9A7H3_9HYPH|nr:LysR family transcriptional regulator [Allorhizobium taibaishanense]MBB4008282.1 DNA-binding transcriptional LysR family regulator [Allorhizobium taibaishanense]OLP50522.1 LysR family transcriptional regulator [Allorhizobium taibaishanense]